MLKRDAWVLVLGKGLRNFGYGMLIIGLPLYLAGCGIRPTELGLAFSVALGAGAIGSVLLSGSARRYGRRAVLTGASLLFAASAALLALATGTLWPVVSLAAGVLSPSGQELGPFLPLEQAALARLTDADRHTAAYAWYNLAGTLASACGSLVAAAAPAAVRAAGLPSADAPRLLIWGCAAVGLALTLVYQRLGRGVDEALQPVEAAARPPLLQRPRPVVVRLTALFALDALGGGLVVQGLMAYWFHLRFGLGLSALGPLFFAANLLSALSYPAAVRIARRFGLLNTMVFTHLPSNLLLMLIPWMPTLPLAAAMLLARQALSRMDIPTRQAYTMALVPAEEHSLAAGWTNGVRPAAAAAAPLLTGLMLAAAAGGLPFMLAGGLKLSYDLVLWGMFRRVRI